MPSNIAEGCGREGERELATFLSMAAGSANETECQLLLARDLGYLPHEAHRFGLRPPSTSLDSVQHGWTPSTPVPAPPG